ncbi:MAG: threonine ammonia-lyase [Pyrinomonadaceae bacterium]
MNVSFEQIIEAGQTLNGIVIHTPTLPDKKLSAVTGAKVFLKAECLQRSGSFKIRGAYNSISKLKDEEKARGVIAASAGNHAQGVALAASLVGIRATIVVPRYAPLTKVNATREYGAEVILHGDSFDDAVAYSREVAIERKLTYVHAFDDDDVIAGQGTIGCEIAEDIPDTSVVVVPIGGGGLISGIAIAIRALLPEARVVGVEAENLASMSASVKAGGTVELPFKATIADGIAIKRPVDRTVEIIREYVDEIVQVSEKEIAHGIFHCIQNQHLVVEGAGASSAAALLAGKVSVNSDDTVCAVLAGGNIDSNLLARVLEQDLVSQGRYVMFKCLVDVRPGSLSGLLSAAADAGANVIEVFHRRAMWLAPLGQVGVELLLEVRDPEHLAFVQKKIASAGYRIKQKVQDEWDEM